MIQKYLDIQNTESDYAGTVRVYSSQSKVNMPENNVLTCEIILRIYDLIN